MKLRKVIEMEKKSMTFWILITTLLMIITYLLGKNSGYNIAWEEMDYNCGIYEKEFDQAILLVQMHCIVDSMNDKLNTEFCDAYMGENATDDNIIDLYKFKS